MEFRCQMCQARLTTADIARQTLSVPTCAGESHRGPFEPVHRPLTCKPGLPYTLLGTRCNCNACRIYASVPLESVLEGNEQVRVAWLRQRPLRRPAMPVAQGAPRRT